jgi:hypothetical protein
MTIRLVQESKPASAPKPSLDELIKEAALLPPGPTAWARIFHHYPELSPEELSQKFGEAARRSSAEADELERYKLERRIRE